MRSLRLVALAAGVLAAVSLAAPHVHAQAEQDELIQVGPDQGEEASRRSRLRDRRAAQPGFAEEAPVAVSSYWIGLGGESLPEALRAHLDIKSDEGLIVRTVADDGPAAEAGVQVHDIILRANGNPITEISQLADEVGEQGEMKGRITLDLLRGGQVKTLWVAPAERPVDAVIPRERRRPRGRLGFFDRDRLRERGGLFGPEGLLGPEGLEGLMGPDGFQLDGQGLEGLGEMMPQIGGMGVSVRVQRQDNGPAKVTVQRGGETWEFDEGDQQAINELPADIQGMVQGMLGRNGAANGDFEAFGFGGPGFQMQFGDDLATRMRELQQRMLELQGGGAAPQPQQGFGGVDPDPNLDEAPAFEAPAFNAEAPAEETLPKPAEDTGPVEIEIPGE